MMARTISGSVTECFSKARLEWLNGREGCLLGKLPKFLGLLGQRRQLPLCIRGRKFDELRRRLRHRQLLEKLHGGFSVGLSKFHALLVVILDPFKANRIAMLHIISRFSGGRTHSFNSVLRRDLFSHDALLFLKGVSVE